jgi:membrane-bound lytic murein transglycosylase B
MAHEKSIAGARRRVLIAGLSGAAAGPWLGTAALLGAPAAHGANRKRAASPPPATESPHYGPDPRIEAFAREVASRRGLDAGWVTTHLARARRQGAVERAIMPPPAGTAKNWFAYRDRFVEPRRIGAGATFWQEHAATLARAEERWGVPPEIVVGIIGVETLYGRHMGNFRVIDALATLSFDFPAGRRDRSPFFRSELEEFFVLCEREGTDPLLPRGSFAGAMGLPQFMPGSINRYAVDFDGDGHVDLVGNAVDAIGSVAHYLAAFGWERGVPTHFDVAVPVDVSDRAVLLGPDILPSFTAAQFAERGAELPSAARAHDGLLALVLLENGDAAPTYVAGTRNFYAITRYNWSSYYALAVITLGAAVRRARG